MKITATMLLAVLFAACRAANAGMLDLEADLNTPACKVQPGYPDTEYVADGGLSMRLGILTANFRGGEATWRWGFGVAVQRLTMNAAGGAGRGQGYRATSLDVSIDGRVWSSSEACLAVGLSVGCVFVTTDHSQSNLFWSNSGRTTSAVARFEEAISERVAVVASARSWISGSEFPFKAGPVLSLGIQVD